MYFRKMKLATRSIIGFGLIGLTPGVRIVVAFADCPEKSYRGRKEIDRGVLFKRTQSRITQDVATSA